MQNHQPHHGVSFTLFNTAILAAWGLGMVTGAAIWSIVKHPPRKEHIDDSESMDDFCSENSLDYSVSERSSLDVSRLQTLDSSQHVEMAFAEEDIKRSYDMDSSVSTSFSFAFKDRITAKALKAAADFAIQSPNSGTSMDQSLSGFSFGGTPEPASIGLPPLSPGVRQQRKAKKRQLGNMMHNRATVTDLPNSPTVKIVAYRCQSADLLMDNQNAWDHIDNGLVICISFAKGAVEDAVRKAAKHILALPILTEGQWGDGSKTVSLLEMARKGKRLSLMVIPQAALVCKFNGRTMQYHNQISKTEGEHLYSILISQLIESTAQALAPKKEMSGKEHGALHKMKLKEAVSIHPSVLFKQGQYEGLYSEFDQRGVPILYKDGKPLPKSQKKKLEKIYKSHSSRYDKAKAMFHGKQIEQSPDDKCIQDENISPKQQPEQNKLRLVFGTWGNRQGFKMNAESGPFSHILEF